MDSWALPKILTLQCDPGRLIWEEIDHVWCIQSCNKVTKFDFFQSGQESHLTYFLPKILQPLGIRMLKISLELTREE